MNPHLFSLLDPHSIFGSGSRREKLSNKNRKNARKLVPGNNCKFIQILKVNLQNLHCFLLLSNLFWLLQRQKILHKVIFFKLVWAGSGSALRKTAWSGSAKNECRSTALGTSNEKTIFMLKKVTYWYLLLKGTVSWSVFFCFFFQQLLNIQTLFMYTVTVPGFLVKMAKTE